MLSTQAQYTPMYLPYKFTMPYEDMNLLKEKGKETGSFWTVYSDRANNKSFERPVSGIVKKNMRWKEPFIVVEENDKYIHIFKDPDPSETLSDRAEDYGWVKKENMLLWTKPLHNSKSIKKKAMILNTLDVIKRSLKEGESKGAKFFNDPELTIQNENFANIYSILYIYKLYPDHNNPTSALLGKTNFFTKETINNELVGWVSYSKLTPWDHRVAILPNQQVPATQEREQNGVHANILCEDYIASRFKNCQAYDEKCVFWTGDDYSENIIAEEFRSPVLDDIEQIDKRDEIMKVGFIGEVKGKNDSLDRKQYAKLQKTANDLRIKTRNINIVFVIDGTISMGPYFPKISEAVIQSMEELKQTEVNNQFKFAAIIYRDVNEGPRKIKHITLSHDAKKIARQLRMVEATEFTKGDDIPEAVFYGLKKAMRGINLPTNETNNLILIGDAGDHGRKDESYVPMDEIIELMTDYNYNFFAFQVHYKEDPSYGEFISQTKQILQEVLKKQFENAKEVPDQLDHEISKPKIPLMPVPLDANGGKYFIQRNYINGGVYYLNPNKSLPFDSLRERIVRNLLSINDSANALLERVQEVFMEGGKIGKDDSPFWSFLSKMDDVPPENLPIILSEHYQIYSKGYTPFQRNCDQYPLWEYQLFYDNEGLNDLREALHNLNIARDVPEKRRRFKEVWLEILKGHIGLESSEVAELENYSVGEIEKLVFGLPGTSEFLNRTLRDLEDRSKISDFEFDKWLDRINTKFIKIDKIFNKTSAYKEYFFQSNEKTFFWIPQGFLP